jgi:hypothetical protein
LPVAGCANIVAANQPRAAATASEDIQMADFMISSMLFYEKEMLIQPLIKR